MALATEALLNLLHKQVEDHSTVVWFDPEKSYLDLARTLEPDAVAGAAVHRYDPERGFVWLRRQLEPLWEKRTDPPRLVIYVPLAQAETHDALVEFEVAGAVVRPGQQPPEQNTALAAVARHALGVVFPPAALEEIVVQVEAGQCLHGCSDRQRQGGATPHRGRPYEPVVVDVGEYQEDSGHPQPEDCRGLERGLGAGVQAPESLSKMYEEIPSESHWRVSSRSRGTGE